MRAGACSRRWCAPGPNPRASSAPASMVSAITSKVISVIWRSMGCRAPGGDALQAAASRSAARAMGGNDRRISACRKIGAAAWRCQRQAASSAIRMPSPSRPPSTRLDLGLGKALPLVEQDGLDECRISYPRAAAMLHDGLLVHALRHDAQRVADEAQQVAWQGKRCSRRRRHNARREQGFGRFGHGICLLPGCPGLRSSVAAAPATTLPARHRGMCLERQGQAAVAYDRAGCDWSVHCNRRTDEPTADIPPGAEIGEGPHGTDGCRTAEFGSRRWCACPVADDAAEVEEQPAPPVLAAAQPLLDLGLHVCRGGSGAMSICK